MIEQAIYQALIGHPGLSALIGDRARAATLRQGDTFPAVTYSRVSTSHENDLDGYAGLDNLRIQVDCYAESYMEARAVAAQVKQAMEAATNFTAIRSSDRDIYEASTDIHRVITDFSVWYKEA